MHGGTGYVVPLPSGRYRARLPRSLAKGRQPGETFATETEAWEWLVSMTDELRTAQAEPGTLRAWGEVYLPRRQEQGLVSARSDPSRWKHVVEDEIADMALRAIQPPHIAAFARRLAKKNATRPGPGGRVETGQRLSRQAQSHVLNLLRTALDAAVIDGLIPQNPAVVPRVSRRRGRGGIGPVAAKEGESLKRWTWLTQAEIDQVLGCAALPEIVRLRYQATTYSGLRQGELWALEWPMVRLTGDLPQLTVAESGDRDTTKSGTVRPVPLLPRALEAFRRLWDLAGRPAAGLVFPSPAGDCPRCKRYVKNREKAKPCCAVDFVPRQRQRTDDGGWADEKKGQREDGSAVFKPGHKTVAGIARPVRFHDLRHTCASHLLQGTWGRAWRLEELKDFLGHSSITVTQRYAHLVESALHAAAAATKGG